MNMTLFNSTAGVYTDKFSPADFTWVLLCGFLIFTMQTGFGLLECGIVLQKNETNIMLKNVADLILGGFSYWLFGYGITYGSWKGSSAIFGLGDYAVDSPNIERMGDIFTLFFFQLSFATTAATITSGGMAERVNFKAYCIYCFFATFTYSVQARWVCNPTGFLNELGVIDIAGSGSVHLAGGSAAFLAAWMLGPRLGRYDFDYEAPFPGNPFNVLLGLNLILWSFFCHNSASSHGVSQDKWKFAARAAVNTVIASIGGGLVGFIWGFCKPRRPLSVMDIVNSILGALVSITGGCSVFHTPEAFLTGVIGALVALAGNSVPDLMKIDDPVGATAVHGFGGMWGLLSVALFAVEDNGILGVGVMKGQKGLLKGGSIYLLGVQLVAIFCIVTWSFFSTFIILSLINIVIPLKVPEQQELLGMDFSEHGIRRNKIGLSPALSALGSLQEVQKMNQHSFTTGGDSRAHLKILAALKDLRRQRQQRRITTSNSSAASLEPQVLRNRKMKALVLFEKIFNKLGNRANPVFIRSTTGNSFISHKIINRNKIHQLV